MTCKLKGRAQARQAGLTLQHTLSTSERLIALSSDLQRARDTTAIALEVAGVSLPILTFPALRERRLGDWQGESIDELKRTGARDTLLRWDGRAPGSGESLRDLALRVLPCLAQHDNGGTILVGSHGGVVRTIVGLADGMPLDDLCRWNVPNCEPQIRSYPVGIFSSLLARLPAAHGDA